MEDRRTGDADRRRGDRRQSCWSNDPDRVAEQERLLGPLGQTLFTIRERAGWSREKAAKAAQLHEQTVGSIENMRTGYSQSVPDPQLSSLQCVFAVFGYQLSIGVVRAANPGLTRGKADSGVQIP